MSQTNTPTQNRPALIVFGQTTKGGKHAAWFSADESASAKRAAALRSLAVIDPIPESLNGALQKLARGRFLVGQMSLSKVAPDIYAALLDVFQAQTANGAASAAEGEADAKSDRISAEKPASAEEPARPEPSAPVDPWRQIKIGDVVLAEYSKEDGWWEARIVAIEGDLLRLNWCDGSGAWRDTRGRVALLPPRA